jgi:hypothetical protein
MVPITLLKVKRKACLAELPNCLRLLGRDRRSWLMVAFRKQRIREFFRTLNPWALSAL